MKYTQLINHLVWQYVSNSITREEAIRLIDIIINDKERNETILLTIEVINCLKRYNNNSFRDFQNSPFYSVHKLHF